MLPEVFMLKRHAQSAFGAVYVFPGGVVDPCDERARAHCAGLGEKNAAALLGTNNALDYFSAAIRELFEETGVLLAHPAAAIAENGSASPLDRESGRRRLIAGEMTWNHFLQHEGLNLSVDKLHYFAHWVTPVSEPKRFSTRFFLAVMPNEQHASHDGHELTNSCWMSAQDVLEAQRQGKMRLIYPTYRTLKDIARKRTVQEVVDWARDRQRSGVARVLPAIVDVDGRDKVVFPGDPRYPEEEQE